jgi:hypothetical protein
MIADCDWRMAFAHDDRIPCIKPAVAAHFLSEEIAGLDTTEPRLAGLTPIFTAEFDASFSDL